tara:strand:- start:29 stop:430 length:402 start_codon:yes stop_codon:yes gene_type:complete
LSSEKPGANKVIIGFIKNKLITVTTARIINISPKELLEKSIALSEDIFFTSKYIGINALLIAPSPNNLLNKFGNLKASRKLSALLDAPKIKAKNKSLMYPNILLIKVRKLIKLKDFIMFTASYPYLSSSKIVS